MNLFFRILVAIYAAISTVICGLIMISPFSDKQIMEAVLNYMDVTFYRSNRYDIVIFLFGLVFMLLNIAILFSGFRLRSSDRFYCIRNEQGLVRISANSIENIALAIAKKSGSVRDVKSRARFRKNSVEVSLKMVVYQDTQVQKLSEVIQSRIKDTVEMMTTLPVGQVEVSVEGVHSSDANGEE